jgi:hypothetical protein
VRLVCETVSGYISNLEMYTAEGKKLEDTFLSLLDRNLGYNHHICQGTFYNSVKLAEILLDREVRVCSTVKANGHSTWPKAGRQTLAKRAVCIHKVRWLDGPSVNGQKTCGNHKYDPWHNIGEHRKERHKKKPGNKKPYAVVQYNKFMKGIDRADQYLIYYSFLRKTVI